MAARNTPAPTFDGANPAVTSGLVVIYTTRLGEVQNATVEQTEEGSDGTVRATLLANVDGRWQRFEGVPQSADGGINTWDYVPVEE